MALHFKEGIPATGLQREMLFALDIATAVFKKVGKDCIVTSARSGRHSRYSHHYKGLAVDLRSHHLVDKAMREPVLRDLSRELGPQYQVLLEAVDTPNEHYHIEYDPEVLYERI